MMDISSNVQHDVLEDISLKLIENSKNLNGYVKLFKDIFAQDLPNDFDVWSVKKQCSWINQNLINFFPNVPPSLLNHIPATFCQLNYDRSQEELPEWLDMDKYRRGQMFVHKHYSSIMVSKIIGTMYMYSFNEQLKPIIMGKYRHTPYLGFKTYLSTVKRIVSWYSGDIWVKGTCAYNNMQVARRMHLTIRMKLYEMDNKQIDTACIFANPWCPDRKLLLKDFAAACPPEKFGQRPFVICNKSPYKPKTINNSDMANVQSSFVVLPLLYPQNIGIHNATDEDLDAFCHMWRCFGYFLGLEDEYNFCRGSLEEVKQRMRDLYQYWTIPNFKDITPEWEHMTRCLVESFNFWPFVYMPYSIMVLIAMDALNLHMPHLYASLSYIEWIAYIGYKFVFHQAMKFSSITAIINIIVEKIFNKALNFDSEKLAKIHEISKKKMPDFSITS